MISVGTWLCLQGPEGAAVAARGPSQRSRPPVPVERVPLQQDSAPVPRRGRRERRELDQLKLLFVSTRMKRPFHPVVEEIPLHTYSPKTG